MTPFKKLKTPLPFFLGGIQLVNAGFVFWDKFDKIREVVTN